MSTDDNKPKEPWIEAALPWATSLVIMALMVPGEYTLAKQAGWPVMLAPLYPAALILYGIAAQRWESKADMAISFTVKLACQICTHLVAAGFFEFNEATTIVVVCVPVVMGERVISMALRKQRERREQKAQQATKDSPIPEPGNPPPAPTPPRSIHPVTATAPRTSRQEGWWQPHLPDQCEAHPDTHRAIEALASRNAEWTQDHVAREIGIHTRTVQRCKPTRPQLVSA